MERFGNEKNRQTEKLWSTENKRNGRKRDRHEQRETRRPNKFACEKSRVLKGKEGVQWRGDRKRKKT